MILRLKNNSIFLIIVITFVILTSCNDSIGMGEPVDVLPPSITITSHVDNQWVNDVKRGDPITLKGDWEDDKKVTALQVSLVESGKVIRKFKASEILNMKITEDSAGKGSWSLRIILEESGIYCIRVTALDSIKNEGKADVTIRVELLDPLIQATKIKRYLDSELSVPEVNTRTLEGYDDAFGVYQEGYRDILGLDRPNAYEKIQSVQIDEFQNEAFTLKVEFNRIEAFASVIESRLWVLEGDIEEGTDILPRLHEDYIEPDPGKGGFTPEWTITSEMLEGWQSKYKSGPHFISFELWAWNEANWDYVNNRPNADAAVTPNVNNRREIIRGVLWYPESDKPHIKADIRDEVLSSLLPTITLETGARQAIEMYDDDRISHIYAGFIPRDEFITLIDGEDEKTFMESLAVNTANRNKILNYSSPAFARMTNLFSESSSGLEQRIQNIMLPAGDVSGEFRLIALVKDVKAHFSIEGSDRDVWSVHPLLRVHIRQADEPIIIIDTPAAENTFPQLTGTKFKISGYTIDKIGVTAVQIAWLPFDKAGDISDAEAALKRAAVSMQHGQKAVDNGFHIWTVNLSPPITETLNGVDYKRNNFEQEFDIMTDFVSASGNEASSSKFFIINAVNAGIPAYKTFRMAGHTNQPTLILFYPYQDMLTHDTNSELELHMRASALYGIGFKQDTLKITDITVNNNDPDFCFQVPDPQAEVNEKVRVIPRSVIQNKDIFPEGSQRRYRFEAEDILGNYNYVERTIIMSNIPTLQYINSSNGPGTYQEGTLLRFEAVFSMPVRVVENVNRDGPRLKLYFTNPGNSEPALVTTGSSKNGDYAVYKSSGIQSNTLIFEYTVKSGDNAPLLYTSLRSIDLPSGVQLTTPNTIDSAYKDANIAFANHNNSLQNRAEMTLDAVAPTITRASFGQTAAIGGASYFNYGKTVTLELTTNEQVQVTGSPQAYIRYQSATVPAEFVRVVHNGTPVTSSTLEFRWTVNAANVPESQLTWASPWIQTTNGTAMTLATTDTITDMAGNLISLTTLPTGGNLTGVSVNRSAYIITQAPAVPTYALYAANTGTPTAITGDIKANTARYVRVTGAANNTLYYSLHGGISPQTITASAYGSITDADVANRDRSTYIPSEYTVTAWQVDRAGNTSDFAAERTVTINSRAAELEGISIGQTDGFYPSGSPLTVRLHFSRAVSTAANHSTASPKQITLMGTAAGYTGTITGFTMQNNANRTANTIFTFEGTVPSSAGRLGNIKITSIELNGVTDDFGNAMKTYNTTTTTETASARQILTTSTFNLQRPNFYIISTRPGIITHLPAQPATGNTLGNGGTMTATVNTAGTQTTGNRIVLTFDREVWAQTGGLITVRPWGRWALPPILTTQELDTISNSGFPAMDLTKSDTVYLTSYATRTLSSLSAAERIAEYQRRLKWVRTDGLPEAPFDATSARHYLYNYYVNNTNGIVNTGGLARPDTSSKWVLAFRHDLYGDDTTEQRLRDVFNAAKWKWQEIPSTSGSVVIDPANRAQVTINLADLEPGRIWEVTINEAAFRDAAGNTSEAINASTTAGQGYRFWSAGTAKPVIRVDKHSHGDHYHGNDLLGQTVRPKIDTRVRIDSETPGATIRYSVIRTKYTPAVGVNIFTSTEASAADFFGHANVTNGIGGNTVTGYTNNSIGNGGNLIPPPKDTHGFFNGLLVPVTVETGTATLSNGAINYTNLTALNPGAGIIYREVTANGTVNRANAVFQGTRNLNTQVYNNYREHFFYVGDAYTAATGAEANATINTDADEKLYTGRRDYIAAVATKTAVNTGNAAGGALAASTVAYEGVYKTTLLFRNFGQYSNRMLIQGFDQPVVPATPGFPLRLTYTDTPPAPFDDPHQYTYYTKQAYRQNGSLPNNGNTNAANAAGRNDNNYIWVSWDIVTDWYQTAKGVGTQFNFMQRDNINHNAILATYGGVTYRYEQNYTGGSGGTQ